MELLGSVLGALALLIVINLAFRAVRGRTRRLSQALPPGEVELHREEGLPARIFTNESLPGGLKARVINRDKADLILSAGRLLVCSGAGRIVEISGERPGTVKVVGPRRLVVEGTHPSGRASLRVELVADSADTWAERARALA